MNNISTGEAPRNPASRLLGTLLPLLLWSACLAAQVRNPPPDGQLSASGTPTLLDGVRAFRAERFEEALAIFRRVEVAEQPKDIGFYLGMTLHKLGRHLEALTAFRAAQRSGMREPVADYYQAVSCYRLAMFERARRGFSKSVAGSEEQGTSARRLGSRLHDGAQRFLDTLEHAHFAPDGEDRAKVLARHIRIALQNAKGHLSRGGSVDTALEWLDEAVQLTLRSPERAEHLPALRHSLLRLRKAVRDKPAESDVMALWALVSGGTTKLELTDSSHSETHPLAWSRPSRLSLKICDASGRDASGASLTAGLPAISIWASFALDEEGARHLALLGRLGWPVGAAPDQLRMRR